MANVKTVNDLSEITLVDDGDFLLVWSASAGAHRKAKKVSLFGSEKDAGFGTISPQASLHVFRPGKVAEVRVESASDDALITLDAHSTHDAYQRFLRSGSQRFVAGYDGQDDAFKMGPATSGGPSDLVNPALMINSNGQVGVSGEPVGQAHLTVKAAGHARLITQTANDSASSLAEIEASTNGRDVVISVLAHDTLRTNQRFGQTLGGWVEFLAGGGNLAGAILGTQSNTPLILGTNNQERVRIRGGGKVDIHGNVELGSDLDVAGNLDVGGGLEVGNTAVLTGQVYMQNGVEVTGGATLLGDLDLTGSFDVTNGVITVGENSTFQVWDGVKAVLVCETLTQTVQMPTTWDRVTANTANLYIDSSGLLLRTSSSRRYKADIQDLPEELGLGFVETLRPVTYRSANEEEAGHLYAGLIAEEVEEAGGGVYVERGHDGRAEGLHYPHMVASLVSAIQELAQRVRALEAAA